MFWLGLVLVLLLVIIMMRRNKSKKENLTDILGNLDNMGYSPHFQGTFRRQQDMLLNMYP
jgi:hypothetical protein